ncbi:MAG: acyltransferase [Candidatus Heimdallarchaeota archaeon]
MVKTIILVDIFLLFVIAVVAVALSSFFFNQGVPIWASLALGAFITYIFLILISGALHWLLRMVVGTNSGYLPSWKVPIWGIMAALHYCLFFALQLILPREYIPTFILRIFGLKIGSGSVSMAQLLDPELIAIGKNVYLEPGVIVSGHIMAKPDRRVYRAPVTIEDGVRIGKNAVIAPGVHIGANASILPNTFVITNETLEGGQLYGGNPAIKILNA